MTDVAKSVLAAARSEQSGKIYNVGSGETVSVNRLVELLGGEKINIPRRPGEPDFTYADITRIQKDLQWQPQVPIEQGVAEILNNIDYWREAPVWTPDKIATATQDWFKYLGGGT